VAAEQLELEQAEKEGAKWEFQVHSWFGKLGECGFTSHSVGEPYNPLRSGPTEREFLLEAAEGRVEVAAPAQALRVYSFASVVPHPSKVRGRACGPDWGEGESQNGQLSALVLRATLPLGGGGGWSTTRRRDGGNVVSVG
jgi:hypothetical protein